MLFLSKNKSVFDAIQPTATVIDLGSKVLN